MTSRPPVLTTGTFDCLHAGHISFLRRAMDYTGNDRILVGILSDDFVEQYKNVRPYYTQTERQELLFQATGLASVVVDNQWDFFRQHSPATVVVGSDWAERDYMQQIGCPSWREFQAWGLDLIYIPYTQGISTSDIAGRIALRIHNDMGDA